MRAFISEFNTVTCTKHTTVSRCFITIFSMIVMLCSPNSPAQNFDGLNSAIASGSFGNLNAVIASRHGDIIFEGYYRGTQASDLHQVQSVTKSVGSALVGIAHRQGKIQLDQNMDIFFADLYPLSQGAYQGKSAITVEQILQQRHGVLWDEDGTDYRDPQNPVNQMVQSQDWYQYFLTRPMDAVPGTKFNYSSGASNVMGRLIRVSTGSGPEEFAMQELFEPLGIDQVHWEVYSEDGPGTGLTNWPAPDHDVPLGFSLWLKARDMLKIGELYLNGGVHNGRRLLDESWIDASWTKYSHSGNSDYFPEPGWGHGYQWWIATLPDARGRDWQVFFASGWGSQVIFVVPELELVLVTAADNYNHGGSDVDVLLYTLLNELNPDLDQRFDGSWYDPVNDGQGFQLDILDDGNTVTAYWYNYEADGSGEQRWFLLLGQLVNGVAEMTIFTTSGGVFLQSDPYYLEEWGKGRFSAADCNNIELEIESDEVGTTIPLTRLTGVCFEAP
ncbi:MAG: serine hydrolase [Gammaproteobacteria bacterium]|nr:serine hydrolase [Gammaproteobacteria bacterium]